MRDLGEPGDVAAVARESAREAVRAHGLDQLPRAELEPTRLGLRPGQRGARAGRRDLLREAVEEGRCAAEPLAARVGTRGAGRAVDLGVGSGRSAAAPTLRRARRARRQLARDREAAPTVALKRGAHRAHGTRGDLAAQAAARPATSGAWRARSAPVWSSSAQLEQGACVPGVRVRPARSSAPRGPRPLRSTEPPGCSLLRRAAWAFSRRAARRSGAAAQRAGIVAPGAPSRTAASGDRGHTSASGTLAHEAPADRAASRAPARASASPRRAVAVEPPRSTRRLGVARLQNEGRRRRARARRGAKVSGSTCLARGSRRSGGWLAGVSLPSGPCL